MKARYIFTCLISLLFTVTAVGQRSVGGRPPSFAYRQAASAFPVEIMRVPITFNVRDLLEVDEWSARSGSPLRVAQCIPVSYDISNSGTWKALPGGEHIWTLCIKAEAAKALMLYYEDFYIPKGAELFIYNGTQTLGAYTHETHPEGGLFATEFIAGDELTLEYVASKVSAETPRISIAEVGYGYNENILAGFIETGEATGVCMVNINCEEGAAWQNEKNGVCLTLQKVGSETYICSGSLMNNTAEDFRPLILTARHCALGSNTTASASDMAQWVFYFNLERSECNNTSIALTRRTFTGCRLLANTGMANGSDGMLLQLNSDIPSSYNLYFNGWDKRELPSSSGVGIHHPNGDYKKISTYNSYTKSITFDSYEFKSEQNAHWHVAFSRTVNGHSVTQAGSSGSPLFNENKLVIGTLSGGASQCMSQYAAMGSDYYGKFSYHYNHYQTDSSTRMDVWLDPLNLGIDTLHGRYMVLSGAPANLRATVNADNIALSWDAPSDEAVPVRYRVYRDNVRLADTVGLTYSDSTVTKGLHLYSVSACYADGKESSFSSISVLFEDFKAPTGLKAERKDDNSGKVLLDWEAPKYSQVVYWGTMEPITTIGFSGNQPFYFGQMWTAEDIAPFNSIAITAVRFIPVSGYNYELFLTQGEDRSYTQNVNIANSEYFTQKEVELGSPFRIDASRMLIVALKASKNGTTTQYYAAMCDDGPAVDGKGNIYSFNGVEWDKLYDETRSNRYDINFNVAAVVSTTVPVINSNTSVRNGSLSNVRWKRYTEQDYSVVMRRTGEVVSGGVVHRRSAIPAPFPAINKYIIYRDDIIKAEVSPEITSYTDVTAGNDAYSYEVTAVYGDIESNRSNIASVESGIFMPETNSVGVQSINPARGLHPTTFNNKITLSGYDEVVVSRLEAVNLAGQICLTVHNPSGVVDVSSLKQGVYFFRIWVGGSVVQTVKAIKTR
jgi:hypothetical protein